MRCSIIIRSLNEERYLDQLLLSIAEQSVPASEREIIVVDSGSTDSTLDIARRHSCRILHIRRQDFSFGRSLNIGCDTAKGAILVFISGHCVPASGQWLADLTRPMHESNVAITYGRQIGGPS